MKILHPPGWSRPRGYSNGVAAQGTVVSIAGQIGWNAQQQFETDDLVAQVRQTLANVLAVLAEAGGDSRHLVRMTWYLVDKREYLARAREIGAVDRELMGQNDPARTAVQVAALIADRATVELECTAVIGPDERAA
ncbi:MAG: RidA family protein, partial [Betaproteobacteria bacterium]